MRANAAIFYAPEGYSTAGPRLMGRHAAGEGFLRGWLRHAEVPAYFCYTRRKAHAEQFAAAGREHAGRALPVRWIGQNDFKGLAEAGTLYLPDPNLAAHAWRRRREGAAQRYSLCGITHTIASHSAMDAIADFVRAPLEPWDALICTSRPVLAAARRLLAAEAEWLGARLRAAPAPALPELALIPLGVECEAHAPDAAQRAAWRRRLGAADADVVFLFVGRLSFHAKANPAPMYLALEQAARRSRKRLHLVQAGWFANDGIKAEFAKAAAALCPSVRNLFLDGRQAEVRGAIRQAADVFISLSDNVQETFGLTPAEALAAGLPCVVSDWDGYRDTVRDGVDGWRVPTLAPPPGAGAELAARHEDEIDNYDRYIGYASLSVAVDVAACAEACAALASDPALRRRMGEAGRRRALEEFDWPVIVRRYQELWHALGERRRAAPPSPALASPRRRDPFWLFAEYPTRALADADRVTAAPGASVARLRELQSLGLLGYGAPVLPRLEACEALFERIAAAPAQRVDALIAGAGRERALRAIAWLYKLGLVRLEPAARGQRG